MVFGSWTYDSTKVIVKCERETALFDDPNSFYESAEWKINAIPCREASMPVLGSPHLNYSLVVFTFQVQMWHSWKNRFHKNCISLQNQYHRPGEYSKLFSENAIFCRKKLYSARSVFTSNRLSHCFVAITIYHYFSDLKFFKNGKPFFEI